MDLNLALQIAVLANSPIENERKEAERLKDQVKILSTTPTQMILILHIYSSQINLDFRMLCFV